MSWTAGTFIDTLKTSVEARGGITGLTPAVTVRTYWPSLDEPFTDDIILGHTIDDVQDPAALGQQRYEETVDVDCVIRVVRPGAGETIAKQARDRAIAIHDEIDDQLRDSPPAVGDQLVRAHVFNRRLSQFPSTIGEGGTAIRVALIEFTIQYRARTS